VIASFDLITMCGIMCGMATNLHIDEKLITKALKAGGRKTKRETVTEALEEYIRRREQLKILDLIGTLEDSDFWDPPSPPRRQNGTYRSGGQK
jgi:Arc/MetJ family transcription regulator